VMIFAAEAEDGHARTTIRETLSVRRPSNQRAIPDVCSVCCAAMIS
jgi:hypothetical protein